MKYQQALLTPFLPALARKITFQKNLNGEKLAAASASPLSTFRINTCKSVSKQRTLSAFRINTYAKTGGRGEGQTPPATLRSGYMCRYVTAKRSLQVGQDGNVEF